MTCSINHETMTTKFCSVCGTPKGAAPAAPQWTPPVQQQPAAPQWTPPAQQPPAAPQWNMQQAYAPTPQYSAQPAQGFAFPVATTGKRIGGFFMDALMYIVTCGFGYLIWDLIVWKDGQTPGKQILKMRVYSTQTGRPASWGNMALRQFLIPLIPSIVVIIGALISLSYSPYDYYGDYNYTTNYGPAISGFGYLIQFGFYLTDFIMMVNSPTKQGLRDRMAKTVVLDETVRYY